MCHDFGDGNLVVAHDHAFRAKLAQIVTLAEAGDIAALQAFEINPVSSSPKAMARYRDLCVIAITARLGTGLKAKVNFIE